MAEKVKKEKVCSKCGKNNKISVTECDCGSERFEPEWVLAKGVVNRQTSVQVTNSNPEFGEVHRRITLSKWWPGGSATFHISKPGHWEMIKQIIDEKLTPVVGWESAEKIVQNISDKDTGPVKKSRSASKLVSDHPEILREIVTHVDASKLSKEDFNKLTDTLGEISDVVTYTNAGFREAFLSIVKKLPKQPQRALEDLDLLLRGWNLNVITNVAQQVHNRLDTIKLFEERINDKGTLEITGDNSIHRILERAMWLVDERYWLLHSNTTLRKQIGGALEKKDKKKYGKKRPDFVCGTVGERLVILELKRPSKELTIDDLNQLETYVAVAQKYHKHTSFSAYLVGSNVSDDLRQRLQYRSGNFKVLNYSNLIDDTQKRYKEFLKAIEE